MEEREYQKRNAPEKGALPETQIQMSRSVARAPDAAKDFERVPDVLKDLLDEGELDFFEYGLAIYLHQKMNYRTGKYVSSLAGLHDDLNWDHGEEHLRRRLDSLRRKGWLDYESRRGQAKYILQSGPTWTRALAEGLDFQPPTFHWTTSGEGGSTVDLNSTGELSAIPANTLDDREGHSTEIPLAPSPLDVDADTDVDADADLRDRSNERDQSQSGNTP